MVLTFVPEPRLMTEKDTENIVAFQRYACRRVVRFPPRSRTVIDMTSIDQSKSFFQLIKRNIMSIVMPINRKTFFQPFTPFLDIANKNFEEKLKYSIIKCRENLHCLCIVRILATKIKWNM